MSFGCNPIGLTTVFIAELIRAANEADRLTSFEIKGLLNRSIATIRDMREQRGSRWLAVGVGRSRSVEF
ncbi:hypothetical protein NGR_c11620 [Sinorhizobium fredii NGR234]|uniref:Uncharacterized protein n=1 Tax=Sinorhizobium fredii (strain NBRC 101917 / NGR234) TaxID=394 RepID=C3MAV4_SINFN|nr:hypothetical protein NGR_c11620 [Sinorhizobium fredii NGR234]